MRRIAALKALKSGPKPIARPVKREYYGVALEYRVVVTRPVYNAETDTVDNVTGESEKSMYKCQALGKDSAEATRSAIQALMESLKANNFTLVEGSIERVDIRLLDQQKKPERKVSFI